MNWIPDSAMYLFLGANTIRKADTNPDFREQPTNSSQENNAIKCCFGTQESKAQRQGSGSPEQTWKRLGIQLDSTFTVESAKDT